jgi:glutamine amidotransferase
MVCNFQKIEGLERLKNMCRFATYFGKEPIILDEILSKPVNSLINQSHQARKAKTGINADGFGLGWYSQQISPAPGLFRSIRPAWNDENLLHVASKIQSNCFIGHVRASTIGGVSNLNCHPFSFKNFLFVHNGQIKNFNKIRRSVMNELSDEACQIVRGQTDSEAFFALLMDFILKSEQEPDFKLMAQAFRHSIKTIDSIKEKMGLVNESLINIVLTDGHQFIATRYIDDAHESPLSLYYTFGSGLSTDKDVLVSATGETNVAIVASEPLTDSVQEWREIPVNHILSVDKNFNITLEPV